MCMRANAQACIGDFAAQLVSSTPSNEGINHVYRPRARARGTYAHSAHGGHGGPGNHGKSEKLGTFIGVTMAILGVLLAVCSALVGSERTV